MEGLEDYPVYTRKVYTDVSYLACAKKLLATPDAVYPQFATHNAQTQSAIYHLAGQNYYPGQYEFQCLHGMGEPLYEEVTAREKLGRPCRVYAPVGSHETLLAYLVRRLLENGANSSFVNRIADENVAIEELIVDPIVQALTVVPAFAPHDKIPLPRFLFGLNRLNSSGLDLSNEHRLASLSAALLAGANSEWLALPMLGIMAEPDVSRKQAVKNPADHQDIVGQVIEADESDVAAAFMHAANIGPIWQATSVGRARCLPKPRGRNCLNRECSRSWG